VLRVDEVIALEIYLMLETEGPKKEIFNGVLGDRKRMSQEAYDNLTVLRKEMTRLQGWRNDFAHGVFAIADDEPDNILIVQSKDSARYFAQRFKSGGHVAPMSAQVFSEKEIEAYLKDVSDLADKVFQFGRGL
jgi:hypothetical protein